MLPYVEVLDRAVRNTICDETQDFSTNVAYQSQVRGMEVHRLLHDGEVGPRQSFSREMSFPS